MKADHKKNGEEPLGRSQRPLGRREWIVILAAWLLSSLVLIGVGQTKVLLSREQALRYQEGDIVEEDFVIASDFTFTDEDATAKVVALNRSLVPPVYDVRTEITDSVLERFDRFSVSIVASSNNSLSPDALNGLQKEFPGAAGLLDRESARNQARMAELLPLTRDALYILQYGGIFRLDSQDGGAASGLIEVSYSDQLPGRRVTLIRNAVTLPDNLAQRVRDLDSLSTLNVDDVEFIATLISYFSEPNGFLNSVLTLENMDEAESATESIVVSVVAGTRLLKRGDIVTPRQASVLEALRDRRDYGYHGFVDPLLYMAIIFTLGIVSSRSFGINRWNRKTQWLYISLAGSYVFIAAILVAFLNLGGGITVSVVMPTALFTLLLAQLLQDRRMAVLSSILMALLIFFMTGENSFDFILTLTAGIAGTLSVRRRETRMGLLRAGPRLALMMFVVTFLSGILLHKDLLTSLSMAGGAAANGLITGILSLAFLPLLEHLLNTATTFRLIELSDQNVPVLKRMRLQAPGTYIHSQNVAHLAEAACDAIGADGLLARVGAYYHDIGKVDQAHFFVENQAGENKHDDLKASLSVAVIKSHVKIGIEKGRELRLPDEVLAVIEQHHGTSVIRYFYDRAMKEKGVDSISADDFSYAGPKPMSREAAVVMLADNAEAATRTLKKPTAAKLEKYVWDLIMNRFKTGELNECDLTLRDLETVKDSFVHVLTGHFHTRIEYPKETEEG